MADLMDRDLVALAQLAQGSRRAQSTTEAISDEDFEADLSSTYRPRSTEREGVSLPVAGWYTDPKDSLQRRWWDGAQWTIHVRPVVANPLRFQQPPGQLQATDTRSSIQGLAEDLGARRSRFAPGTEQPMAQRAIQPSPQPATVARGRHAAPTVVTAALPVVPARDLVPRAAVSWSEIPETNPAAKLSVILGAISILIPVVVPSVIALIAGGIGIGRAGRGALEVGRRMAFWGVTLGAAGLVVALIVFALLLGDPAVRGAIGGPTG